MSTRLPHCGIDALLQDKNLLASLSRKRVGVVTNQNALTQNYKTSAHALAERLEGRLKCILTPEHGWSGLVREGVKIGNGFDPILQLPIFSLYGKSTQHVEFIKENLDVLLIDLQDVGLRCYTYVSTCAQLLEACSDFSLEIIVCDRPNPLGSQIRGPLLDPQFRSIVGYVDEPFQHGKTMGQLLSTFNQKIESRLPLTVIPCPSSHKPYYYPWISPSPNLPAWDSVLLYPGLVLLEGTNISEGRGTSFPFTCLGAPGLDNLLLVDYLNEGEDSRIRARPISFTPQSGKHEGVVCEGVQILLFDSLNVNAFALGIKIIFFLKENYPNFKWEKGGAKKDKYFIDYLLGTSSLREGIEQKVSVEEIFAKLRV